MVNHKFSIINSLVDEACSKISSQKVVGASLKFMVYGHPIYQSIKVHSCSLQNYFEYLMIVRSCVAYQLEEVV
jgi:hypothetical protein